MSAASSDRQAGFSLLEVLISMVLLLLIGLGLAHISARSTLGQQQLDYQSLAHSKLREHLQKGDNSVPNPTLDLTDNVTVAGRLEQPTVPASITLTATVAGTSIPVVASAPLISWCLQSQAGDPLESCGDQKGLRVSNYE